jgi:shikimate kinase / 3-dehydroquinate synthase
METQYVERIILIGPTGSGKTSVGAAVASLLGWSFVDTDALVEQVAGMSIPAIFTSEGEAHFRERESAALLAALERVRAVIATGGGIGERPAHTKLMRSRGWVVCLMATPETVWHRLTTEGEPGAVATRRPMLAGSDPLARLHALQARRQGWYAAADETIRSDDLVVDDVAARVAAGLVGRGLLAPQGAEAVSRHVRTRGGDEYAVAVAWGGLAQLGAQLTLLKLPRRLHLIADASVATLYEPAVMPALLRAGFEPLVYRVPTGEVSKSREQLEAIYDWLAERRAERHEALVALGGGVVGDLAGFAAATYLRGMPLVQVPTSLLAQVDAAVGGKTGINHRCGKNLIGAFYPPRLVLTDPAALLTLPARQRAEGWAEAVKHGVALDAAYFALLEREATALLEREPAALTRAIAGSVAIKASVVEGDEREREGGARHLLNYGHTLAHAIEAVTGYSTWLHGEAVAVGMVAAARLGQRSGLTPAEVVARLEALLARFGLPIRAERLSISALLSAALWDKKVRGGQVRWVLPTALGAATLTADVPEQDVRAVLREIGAVDDEPECG